ncbi:MAG: hypothetical protein EOO39_09520 [Cytophagaceae bacterium]|nr:MAG: hypothetical protein EOO39_09520 [Cytophagaceae bacterium]
MTKYLLPLSFILITGLCGFEKSAITVSKDFSDRQIKRAERQASRRFGAPVRIQVLSRNEKNEITNLEFFRYTPDGRKGGGCSSDKFGVLVVTAHGCRIADIGHETDPATLGK